MSEKSVLAVIGGSGLYNFPALKNVKMLDIVLHGQGHFPALGKVRRKLVSTVGQGIRS